MAEEHAAPEPAAPDTANAAIDEPDAQARRLARFGRLPARLQPVDLVGEQDTRVRQEPVVELPDALRDY